MTSLLNIIIFYIFVLLTSIIIISYGRILSNIFKINEICISLNVIFGCFFLGILSLIINFVLPINIYVGNTILVLGIIFFLKDLKYFNKQLKFLIIISIIAFVTGIYENIFRPDAALYHLPFISNLNENKIILGLNNLHSRFGFISFFQYISSTLNNSIFINKAIFFPNLILFSSSLVYFLKLSLNKNSSSEIKILSLFFVICIALDMNRFSEFGNDENAHMLYFILVVHIIVFFTKYNTNQKNNLKIILLISLFLFMIKTIYSLVIFLVLYVIFKSVRNFKIFSVYNFFLSLIFFLWLLKNFLISGCLIYPVEATCVDQVFWSYNSGSDIIIEAWAKGFPDSNTELDMKSYIKNFVWLQTWSSNHLLFILKKLSLLLISITILILIFYRNGPKFSVSHEIKIILILNLIFCLVWFFKFPVYRFGTGFLISLIVLSSVIFVKKFDANLHKKSIKIILPIIFLTICYKNFDRVLIKFNSKIYSPWINIYSNFEGENIYYKKINFLENEKEFYYVPKNNKLCFYSPSPCTHQALEELYLRKIGGYKIISRAR